MALTQFNTTTLLSFAQWLDNRLLQDGQAYFTTTSRLYYQPDTRLPAGYVAYASPFRGWVYDSGVSGAVIADRISGSLGLGGTGSLLRGQSGLQIDYENGRVILPSSVGTTAVISGTYSVKEFNVYFTNQSAERIVFTDKYYLNSRFARPITGIPPPYEMVTPAIFVTNVMTENKPWAMGGVYNSTMTVGLVVLAENLGQVENALSLLVDSEQMSLAQMPASAWPLNPMGDTVGFGKSGYNYATLETTYGQPSNLYLINDVTASKVNERVRIDEGVFIGLADVKLEKPRTIH